MNKYTISFRASAFYALRELVRRPRETAAMIVSSCSVLLALIMLLMYFEASWRAEVMPDNEENYHFYILGLSESEKQWIRGQDWVQITYDIDDKKPQFRVRVTWENAASASKYAAVVFNTFELYSRSEYISTYTDYYNTAYDGNKSDWLGMTVKNGRTLEQVSTASAKRALIRLNVMNRHFCYLTGTSYMVRPDNILTILLFALFLGSSVAVLLAQRCRRGFSEYGSLRAFGFTQGQLYAVFTLESAVINASALPPAWLLSILAVKTYSFATASVSSSNVYLTLLDYVPVSNILVSFFCLLLASCVGALLVCRFYIAKRGICELLRAKAGFEVSFVSRTSRAFERARGAVFYALLYIRRAWRPLCEGAAACSVMLPLPLFYLSLMFSPVADRLTLYYFGFQTAVLALTSASVVAAASLYSIRGRKSELSILRATGMTKKAVVKTVIPYFTFQCALSAVCSSLLYSAVGLAMSRSMQSNYSSMSDMYASHFLKNLFQITLTGVVMLPAALVMIAPFFAAGVYVGLRSILRGGISDGIREAE